jgi:hypothetical protein
MTSLVDAGIRQVVAPAIAGFDGVFAFFAGRSVDGERILASVWDSEDAVRVAAGQRIGDATALFEQERGLGDCSVEIHPIRVEIVDTDGDGKDPAILRVFRGRVLPGELEPYIEEARVGALADISAGHGALAFFLATCDEDDFLSVSAWPSWEPIQAATGGNITRPIATKNTARLAGGAAQHYEIVPNAIGGLVVRPSVVD